MIRSERPKVGRPVTQSPQQLLERLVEAAVQILVEQAADADFSVAQLAQRAGMSKRTVYTVLDGKEELIAHIIRRGAQSVSTILDQPVAGAADARVVLAAFLAQWASLACAPQAIGIYVMAIRERSRYPAIGAAYQRSRDEHGFQKMVAWLARMHGQRWLRADDPVMTADFVLSMVTAERQRMLALGLEAPLTAPQLATRIEAILEFVFREQGEADAKKPA